MTQCVKSDASVSFYETQIKHQHEASVFLNGPTLAVQTFFVKKAHHKTNFIITQLHLVCPL